ncbi:MAG: hypothetical protein K2M94_01860 [Paramuribaculum sp.]|nr:hypothetical protein [Paramuribaculum sp.]
MYYNDASVVGVPLFADLRSDFLNNWITPFVDVKIGYSVADVEGFYFAPSLGCRFGLSNKLGIQLAIGYSLQLVDVTYGYYDYYYGHYFTYAGSINADAITIKVGIEF